MIMKNKGMIWRIIFTNTENEGISYIFHQSHYNFAELYYLKSFLQVLLINYVICLLVFDIEAYSLDSYFLPKTSKEFSDY